MKHFPQLALLMIALAGAWGRPAAEVIDRIVVLVNGQPIVLSEWEEALRYQALLEHRPLEQLTPEDERQALERLIDQELLLQQMRSRNLPAVEEAEVDRRLAELRRQAGAPGDAAWNGLLQRYGLSDKQVRRQAAAQLNLMRYVSVQILPGVRVEARNVLAYYRRELVPELRRRGEMVPELESVSDRIREILAQRQADELLREWLATLRRQSEIRVPGAGAPAAAGEPAAARSLKAP
jgi:hypothetical protein